MNLFQNNKFTLYNKNNKILDFHCDRVNGEPVFIIDKQHSDNLPFGFQNINKWIENRRAPKHREHIKEILEKCGCNDLEGYVRFTYCTGLNDTFWVKPEERNLSWNDVSLYQNEFDENIARIAFDGGLMGERFTSTTPELATDGIFPKCWRREDNEIYLYKQGSSGARNAGREPYSELYACELAECICDNPVSYDVVKYRGKIAAKCKLFTDEQVSYAPMAYVLNTASFDKILNYFDSIGAGEKFRQMIVLDALTMNTDRHLKNFGILYNADTMAVIDMAPVFDNNLSLCPFAENEDLRNLDKYLPTRSCAFDEGFNELAIQCLTDDIKMNLKNLKGFSFTNNYKYHLPSERLNLLSNMVNYQIDNLLKGRVISVHYDEKQMVNLDNFCIKINCDNINEGVRSLLKNECFSLSDFALTMANGDKLFIEEAQYMVNEYAEKFTCQQYIEVEIINAKITGKTDNLHVCGIDNLYIYDGEVQQTKNIHIDNIEVQLSIEDNVHNSTLNNAKLFITSEHVYKNEILPSLKANWKNIAGSINNKDTVSLNERISGIRPIKNTVGNNEKEKTYDGRTK